jgi:nitrite reductase (NADH) small subunit
MRLNCTVCPRRARLMRARNLVKRYVVGSIDEFLVGDRRIVSAGRWGVGVFNVNGAFHALNNVCPHAGGPLCLGAVTGTTQSNGPHELQWVRDGEILRCPWHKWEFDIATGRTLTEPFQSVQTFPVTVENGSVILEFDR